MRGINFRLQTALSANASYASLTIENALKLLHINSIQELRQYAASQNFSWRVDSTHVYFENVIVFTKLETSPSQSAQC